MQTYRTPEIPAQGESGGVVVVHCADPRYQPHFQEFLRNGLGIPHYALIAAPGGAHFLTDDDLREFSRAGWRWMKFVMNLTKPRRVILIGHDDCRWYLDSRLGHDSSRLRGKIETDLRRVASAISERFPGAKAELYFARLEADDRAKFESF